MPEKVNIARLSLKIAGLLFFAAACLFLFILVSGNIMVGFGGLRRELLGNRLLSGAGVLLLVAAGAAGAVCLRTASGVARQEKKARDAGLGIGFLLLPLIPFGPILGALILSGLLGDEARSWFTPSEIPPRPRPMRAMEGVQTEEGRQREDEPGP
jgi:hypothetical protein